MVATIQDMPVAQLYLVEPLANTGVGGQVTFYWNEGDNGAFKAVDNVPANDTLITEGFLALSALKGTTGMEYVYVTGGTSNYLSDGVRQVTYTLTARGLAPTNKSNPPSAGFARFYKSHLADALCVFSETTLTREMADDFITATQVANNKYPQISLFDKTADFTVVDGRDYFYVNEGYDNHKLTDAKLFVTGTAGTTGTTDVQIHNVTDAVDMLTTKLTVDSGETSSLTAATPVVIDTSNDTVSTDDVLRIDIDAVSSTAPKGGLLSLKFTKIV